MKGTNAVSVGDDSDQQPETMTLEKLRCRFGINYMLYYQCFFFQFKRQL